jgi:hypothetical protein
MRKRLIACVSFALLLTMLVSPAAIRADVGAKGARPSAVQATIENAHIRIIAFDNGSFTLGTTGGDPASNLDDNKPLMWGYPSETRASSYSSLRVTTGGVSNDLNLGEIPTTLLPTVQDGAIVTRWEALGVQVTQRLSLARNPYTNRNDMAQIQYTLRNTGGQVVQAGVRCMLDTMIGSNDFAPFFIPGTGKVNTEHHFRGGAVPEYFKAFESATYASDSLRAQGLLRGFGMTDPDRFVLASWRYGRGGSQGAGIYDFVWDYGVTPGALLGDSAVALWWGPYDLAPGAARTVVTGYGLGSAGGGDAWLDVPAVIACGQSEFTANLWVSNTSSETLMGGQARITLPDGLALATGQSETMAFGDLVPNDARSVAWHLHADTTVQRNVTLRAAVTFANLDDPLDASAEIVLPACATATPGPTATPRPTPTPGPQPTPEVPEPTAVVLLATGLAGLAAAWRRAKR